MDLGMDGVDVIHMSDVADIVVVDDAQESYAKLNGQPGIMLSIAFTADFQRSITIFAQIVYFGAKLPESVDKYAHRTTTQRCVAVKHHFAAGDGGEVGGEQAQGSAACMEVDFALAAGECSGKDLDVVARLLRITRLSTCDGIDYHLAGQI